MTICLLSSSRCKLSSGSLKLPFLIVKKKKEGKKKKEEVCATAVQDS